MPVAILGKEVFKGKDGREWVKLHAIDEHGKVVDMFFSKADFDAFELPDGVYATKAMINKVFAELPNVNVTFGQRGRIEKIAI